MKSAPWGEVLDDDYPTMECPRCHRESPDLDGFGVMYCSQCGFCRHASIIDGVCQFCGNEVR
jgi:ribosomal protein L37AE/L43A